MSLSLQKWRHSLMPTNRNFQEMLIGYKPKEKLDLMAGAIKNKSAGTSPWAKLARLPQIPEQTYAFKKTKGAF